MTAAMAYWRQITKTLWRDERGREIDALHGVVLRRADDSLIGEFNTVEEARDAAWLEDIRKGA